MNALIRMALVASILSVAMRFHYYKSIAAINNRDFIQHFLKRVLPLTCILSLIFKFIFDN
jgi:hypothetical protein